jgi:hypothetical protein
MTVTEDLEHFASHGELTAHLSGRLDGLAGSVRYDLTDDDREALKMAATILNGIATREHILDPLREGKPYRVVEDQPDGSSTVTPLPLAAVLGIMYRLGEDAVKNGGKVDLAFIGHEATDFEHDGRPHFRHVWKAPRSR